MGTRADTVALIALLTESRRSRRELALLLRDDSPDALLRAETGLLADDARQSAAERLASWEERHIRVITLLDEEYPENLRNGGSAPPLILFAAGPLPIDDPDAVAVVGTREPTPDGLRAAAAIARRLVDGGRTVVSGLAAGIDAAAHAAALAADGRTIGVIGSGLHHAYPRHNAELQREIARRGALVSQFWPEDRPTRQSFPMRNALMAAMTSATVIVEASERSGTRIQARAALAAGRQVLLTSRLLAQPWARELAEQPHVHVVSSAAETAEKLESLRVAPTLL